MLLVLLKLLPVNIEFYFLSRLKVFLPDFLSNISTDKCKVLSYAIMSRDD